MRLRGCADAEEKSNKDNEGAGVTIILSPMCRPVARMKGTRAFARGHRNPGLTFLPDFAALHPGYKRAHSGSTGFSGRKPGR